MRIDSLIQKVSSAGSFFKKEQVMTPPLLSGAVRFPYGPFQFTLQLAKGQPYEIHASTDLKNWSVIARDIATADCFEHLDSDASKFSHRFYRVTSGVHSSLSIIGYASMTLPPGFSMIANQFDAPSNSVGELFKDWPDGTTLSRFDMRLFRLTENKVVGGKWTNPTEQLQPGDGAIFFNSTSDYKALTFVGEVIQGGTSIPIPAGFSVRSSLVPQSGSLLEDLSFPISNGDVIHLYDRDRQAYVTYPYEDGKWKSGPPMVSVGESFWVAKTVPENWSRDISVS
ncbi:MAG TPA: hypothetical protein VFM25_05155 [Verrucomicrobiae bacterium]|nr:hypothetical protein [Verrucomicrobiae bacterium]